MQSTNSDEVNQVNGLKKLKLSNSDEFGDYVCAKNKDYSSIQYKVERDFIESKLWRDINDHDLSSWGSTPSQQLQVIEGVIERLKRTGFHDTHYLLVELSFPRIALLDMVRDQSDESYHEILDLMLDRNRKLKSLCNRPNVRVLNNEMEYIHYLENGNVALKATNLTEKMKHIQEALKLAYMLYPKDEHPSIIMLKRELLQTEKLSVLKGVKMEYEASVCVICRVEGMKTRCGRCHKVYYCGIVHQREHWQVHRSSCQKLSK